MMKPRDARQWGYELKMDRAAQRYRRWRSSMLPGLRMRIRRALDNASIAERGWYRRNLFLLNFAELCRHVEYLEGRPVQDALVCLPYVRPSWL